MATVLLHPRTIALRTLLRTFALFAISLLIAAPAWAASVSLAWDAVADSSVAGYMVHIGPTPGNYTTAVDVGKVTTATINNLTEGTTYNFVVAAYDATHTEGAMSNNVVAVISYTVPVAKFSASVVSGVAPLMMNFIDQSTGTITSYQWTFGDGTTGTAQNPSKTYSNPGTYSVGLTVSGPGGTNALSKPNYITVTAATDTTAPGAPGSLTATANGSAGVNLSWPAATDNVGVTGYRVERCLGATCATFAQIATPTGTSFSDTGLTANTTYRYRVRATDAAGNLGSYSPIASATTAASADTTPPSAPATLTATASGSAGANLSWTAATDNVGVTGYRVERCLGASCTTFAQIATPTGTSFSDTGLTANTTYRYRVRATDSSGNLGSYSPIASATTAAGADTTPPSAPGTLSATANGSTGANLSWSAATDNVAVTGYRVERCLGASCTTFAQIAAPTGTSFSDTGLSASSTYRYRVRATDATGNLGGYSPIASATTAAGADTTPPSAPPTLSATANGTNGASLSWAAASDNVGVTGYRVERCQGSGCSTFAQIAAPATTSFSDAGLSASTNYSYRVRAADAAGNLGPYSNAATMTTGTAAATPIAYVQNNYATPQNPQTSVTVAYKSVQTAGNLNVVVVGWNDTTATVTSVTDSMGNVYTRAVGPTTYSNQLSQSIYYAKNIAGALANSNSVTVKFSAAAVWADIRVVEYAGIDRTNPVDVVAVGSGSSSTSATSAVATTSANDLLFGASTVRTIHSGPGSGFTSRVITVPDGDIVEDRVVTSVGSYSATAPLSSGSWVMQMVAFRGM